MYKLNFKLHTNYIQIELHVCALCAKKLQQTTKGLENMTFVGVIGWVGACVVRWIREELQGRGSANVRPIAY